MKPVELSPKLIYLLLVIALVFPLIKPMGLPLPIMQGSKLLYDEVQALAPGSTVLVSLDWAVEQSIELLPQMRIVLQHLFLKQGIKVVMVSFWEQGPMFAEQILKDLDKGGKQDGKDYVNLGFVSGGEPAIAAFARDPLAAVRSDFQGRATSGLEVLQGIKSITDFSLLVVSDSGIPGAAEWVRQAQVPYKVKMACLGTLGTLTMAAPFVQAKQIFALMGGVRGAAEYETLMRRPGLSTAGMDAQSIGHLYIILLLVLGNLNAIWKRSQAAATGKEAR